MTKLLIGMLMLSFLVASTEPEPEIARYQIEVTTYTTPKKGKVYILETVLDTKTGKIVSRKKIYHTNYKFPRKDRHGRTIKE